MGVRPIGGGLRVVAAALLLGCAGGSAPERVVLISIDTLRADHVGCYGAVAGATPTIDALAAAGVRFETVSSPAPLTLPAHATLLTGMEPPRHGVHNNGTFVLEEDVPLLQEEIREAGWSTGAFVGSIVLDRQYGLARGFDRYDDNIGLRRAAGEFGFAERRAAQVVEAALAWVSRTDGHFLLWVHLYDPHATYDPPPRQRRAFADPYTAEIAYADEQLGRLLGEIDSRWPDGRTLVVVTSDHGESRGEHGESTHGYSLYEATQLVPLVIAGPGLPRGQVVQAPARLSDVAPTIRGLLGGSPRSDVDGRDLRLLLDGTDREGRTAYLETIAPRFDYGWSALYGLRTPRFKYVRAPRPELYDLETDPDERENLARLRPDLLESLDRALSDRLRNARPLRHNIEPDSAERARLASLGYVVGSREVALGEVGGVDPKDAMPELDALGKALARLTEGRPEDALEQLGQIGEGGAFVELLRADVALRAGRADLAEQHARAALELGGGHGHGARINLAEAYAAQGRSEEAEALLLAEVEADPASGYALTVLGRIAEASGDRKEAARRYRQAVARRGSSPEGVWRLAALQIEAGELDEADARLGWIAEAERLRPAAVERLARAELRAGLVERARTRLREALRRTPRAPKLLALQEELPTGDP